MVKLFPLEAVTFLVRVAFVFPSTLFVSKRVRNYVLDISTRVILSALEFFLEAS